MVLSVRHGVHYDYGKKVLETGDIARAEGECLFFLIFAYFVTILTLEKVVKNKYMKWQTEHVLSVIYVHEASSQELQFYS